MNRKQRRAAGKQGGQSGSGSAHSSRHRHFLSSPSLNMGELLAEAVRRHQAGQFAEAEPLYHRVLSIQPGHAGALHLSGLLAYQSGRLELAGDRIGQALATKPDFPEALSTLGLVLRAQGRLAEAVDCFAKAVGLRPDYADAFQNLGNALRMQGKLEEAVAASRRAIVLKPQQPEAHANLGAALMALGRLDEAIAALTMALRQRPNFPEALAYLGNTCFIQGRHEDAVTAYRQALALRPHFPEAHADLGRALRVLGRPDEAISAYRIALDQHPAFPQALNNIAAVLFDGGRYDEAMDSARKALAFAPHDAEAWFILGNATLARGRRDEAIDCYARALALKPDHPEALSNLGKAQQEQGKLEEAIASFRRALALRPGVSEIHNNLGSALADKGRLDEAIACFRQALALRPDLPQIHNNLGSVLTDQGRLDEAIAAYRSALTLAPDAWQAHSNFIMSLHYSEPLFEQEHARTVQSYADRMATKARTHAFPNVPDPGRPMRVGYVSADLRAHPVGYFLSCFLPAHSPSNVQVFCYSNTTTSDAVTAHLQANADHWRLIAGQSDDEVASLIRQDGIDILVDLSGHTARNRLTVFAGRAAPVQVTALGYFGTTGLATMDYILADRFVVPQGEEALFSEMVWRLPDSYICFAPPAFDVSIQARPAGDLKLGCFNNWSKVSEGTIALWARVLRAIPESQLLLKTRFLDDAEVRHSALQRFARHGVDPARLTLEGPCPRAELLAAYNRIDIALDPFPFGGGATTAEALWMGVPVVTLRGNRWVGRVAESILTAVGRPDLVAGDAHAYVELVQRLAADPAIRGERRSLLRTTMLNSPLCDGQRYARALEAAYRAMWSGWCARQTLPIARPG